MANDIFFDIWYNGKKILVASDIDGLWFHEPSVSDILAVDKHVVNFVSPSNIQSMDNPGDWMLSANYINIAGVEEVLRLSRRTDHGLLKTIQSVIDGTYVKPPVVVMPTKEEPRSEKLGNKSDFVGGTAMIGHSISKSEFVDILMKSVQIVDTHGERKPDLAVGFLTLLKQGTGIDAFILLSRPQNIDVGNDVEKMYEEASGDVNSVKGCESSDTFLQDSTANKNIDEIPRGKLMLSDLTPEEASSFMTPTKIGQSLRHKKQPTFINSWLEKNGFQEIFKFRENETRWKPTEKGKEFGCYAIHLSYLWQPKIVDIIQSDLDSYISSKELRVSAGLDNDGIRDFLLEEGYMTQTEIRSKTVTRLTPKGSIWCSLLPGSSKKDGRSTFTFDRKMIEFVKIYLAKQEKK